MKSAILVNMRTYRPAYALVSLTILAFVLNMWWMYSTGTFHATPLTDEANYRAIAHGLVSGFGFSVGSVPVADRSPLYPIFIAASEWLFGPSPEIVRVLQAIIVALGVPLIWYIGSAVSAVRAPGAGWIAAVLYTGDPYILQHTRFLVTEPMLALLFLVDGAIAIRCYRAGTHRGRWLAILGITLGLSIATRSQAVLTAALLILWLCIVLRKQLHPARIALVTLGGIVVVLSPWVARNWLVYQQFIPLTAGKYASAGGYVFWTSNNAIAARPGTGDWGHWVSDERLPEHAEYKALPDQDLLLADRMGYEYGLRFLSQHPEAIPDLLVGKALLFWDYTTILDAPDLPRSTFLIILGMLPFFILGLGYQLLHIRQFGPLLAIVGALFASALLYWGDSRFRDPIEPYLVLALAIGLSLTAAAIHQLRTMVEWRFGRLSSVR